MSHTHLIALSTRTYVPGQTIVTTATVLKWHTVWIEKCMPLVAVAERESVGARRESLRVQRIVSASQNLPIAGSERAATMVHAFLGASGPIC